MRSGALASAFIVGLVLAAPAHADRATSLELFDKGKRKYNLGEFGEAIALFRQAYEEHPAPAYLYNIAQSYRQLADCKKALFFYERFMVEKPEGAHVASVEASIAELRAECGGAAGPPGGPGPGPAPIIEDPDPAAAVAGTGATPTATSAPGAGGAVPGLAAGPVAPGGRAPVVAMVAAAGAAIFDVGDVIAPVTMLLHLGAAYPMHALGVDLEAGLAVGLAPMPYEALEGTRQALWSSVMLTLAVRHPLAGSLAVRGELGLGALMVPGFALGNPFTEAGQASDRVTELALRLAGGGEYRLGGGLAASLELALSRAGAGAPLRDAIGSISQVEALAGVRYRW